MKCYKNLKCQSGNIKYVSSVIVTTMAALKLEKHVKQDQNYIPTRKKESSDSEFVSQAE